MLDIGWSEILVIAVVLIVIVGPKDLPPMIRAFGKMTSNLRKMAGDFRSQFDEALREADMDDVRRTISDVQNLNPTNSLRDAMNPLRQLGQDIKSDLQKATTLDDTKSSIVAPSATPVTVPEPSMTLPDTPPVVVADVAAPAPVDKKTKAPAKPRASKAVAAKTATTPASEVVTPVKPAPKAKAKTASATPASTKAIAAKKLAAPKAPKEAAAKPAAVKKPVVRKAAATAKTAKKDEA